MEEEVCEECGTPLDKVPLVKCQTHAKVNDWGGPTMASFVPDALHQAAETYEQRNAQYGDSYKSFGKIMLALFPDGLKYSLLKEEDWNRLAVLIMMVGKLHRYAPNFFEGGHSDSLHDMAVYAMMLDELDENLRLDKKYYEDQQTEQVK